MPSIPTPARTGSTRASLRFSSLRPSRAASTAPTPPRPARQRFLSPRPLHRLLDALTVALTAVLVDVPSPAITTAVTVAVLQLLPSVYRARLNLSALDVLPFIVTRGAVIGFLAASLATPQTLTTDSLLFAGAVALALSLTWTLTFTVTRWWRRRSDRALHPTLILGSPAANRTLITFLTSNPQYGLRPVAVVDRGIEPGADIPGVATEHLADNLPELIHRYRASVVIVGQSRHTEDYLLGVFRASLREKAEFYIMPRLPVRNPDHGAEQVGIFRLHPVARTVRRSFWWALKRPVDIVLSALALLLLAPFLLLIAAAAKITSPHQPVIFRQTRIGLDGRPFELLKFRTLTPASTTESDITWNVAHDDRLTPLGRFLRSSSLDELPQLLNVLRGDMTLVGPRPERPHFVDKFGAEIPDYLDRHRAPVGLTGWAAINGLRGDTCIRSRAAYDNWYIEHWTPWLDVKIILLTVRAVLGRTGG